MKFRGLLAATAALGFLAVASASNAAIVTNVTEAWGSYTITTTALSELGGYTPGLTPAGFTMIQDFDNGLAAGYSQTGLNVFPGGSGLAAAPPGDGTKYQSVQPNSPYVLTVLGKSLSAFAFVMGSPDDSPNFYNELDFQVKGGPLVSRIGTNIWGGNNIYSGNQTAGFLITYTFATNSVTQLTFNQAGNPAFEFDNLSGKAAVPEPTSWALMIMGFGGVGATLRSRRKLAIA